MYCTNCGKKLREKANYCTNCGKKVNANNNKSTNIINHKTNFKLISLILGIISILSILVFNIFAIPIAIAGIIFGLKSSKKINLGIILNIIALVLSIILITLFALFIINIPSYLEEKSSNIVTQPYQDNDKELNTITDLLGKWYLYENGIIYDDNYCDFDKSGTYKCSWEGNYYNGNYKIEYEITSQDRKKYEANGYTYYTLTLIPTSIRNSEGVVENSNLIARVFTVAIKNEDMQVTSYSTNSVFNLKKEILEVY